MRIFFLRVLIAWWLIPIVTLSMLILGYLMTGELKEPLDNIKSFSKDLWYGVEKL